MGDTERQRATRLDPSEHLSAEVLNAYLDGGDAGLSPTARAYTAAHLADCADCRAALNDLATTVAILGALPQLPLRRSFILTEEAAAATGGPRLRRPLPGWIWPTRWATAFAAVIFAVTIGLDLGGGGAATPAAAPPPPQTAVAVAASTPCPVAGCLTSFVDPTSVIIFPTPTAVIQPAATPNRVAAAPVWRPLQLGSGLLTLLGIAGGFVLPAYRRRSGAA